VIITKPDIFNMAIFPLKKDTILLVYPYGIICCQITLFLLQPVTGGNSEVVEVHRIIHKLEFPKYDIVEI